MTTGNGSSTNASDQGEQKIAISTDTVKWLLGGMGTMLLVLIGFAFWLGSLHARIADIDAIKSDLKTHDSRLSALDGARANFEARILKLENKGPTSETKLSEPGAPQPGNGTTLVGIDSNVERLIVDGDLRVKANVWGINETTLDSGRGNDVRCPEGQFVVGVRAIDTDGGGYCEDCVSVVRVFCRAL